MADTKNQSGDGWGTEDDTATKQVTAPKGQVVSGFWGNESQSSVVTAAEKGADKNDVTAWAAEAGGD